MANVKHKIFVGHPSAYVAPVETFYMLTQTGDYILTEEEDITLVENG